MQNNSLRCAWIFGVLIAGILCCLAWVVWAVFFRAAPPEIPADAFFVREVVGYASI